MLSLATLQRGIEAGELSAEGALARSLEAIEDDDAAGGAFVRLAKNPRAENAGPLTGITVGIKDIIDTAVRPAEMGSVISRGWQPRANAAVVMSLKASGATIVG